MTTPHAHILNQLAAGDITPDEAAARLRGDHTASAQPAGQPVALANRWLHVRVTDLDTGRQRVQVNLPLALVAAGLQLGARYTPQLGQLDLGQILADIHAGASGRLVEVEDLDDGQRVEIFVD